MENLKKEQNNNLDIKTIIAQNIARYRKLAGLTQFELAEKLNYSDKTLSKWERGEAIPDIITLKQLADLFGISVEVLISEKNTYHEFNPRESKKGIKQKNPIAVTLLSVCIVWLVAIITYATLKIIPINFDNYYLKPWIAIIYALPISSIVTIVFSAIARHKIALLTSTSCLIWTGILAIHLSFKRFDNTSQLYFIAIPLQIMAIIYFIFIKKNKK